MRELETPEGLEKHYDSLIKYNPDQPRDEKGRWTAGGEGAANATETRQALTSRGLKGTLRQGFNTGSHQLYHYSTAEGEDPNDLDVRRSLNAAVTEIRGDGKYTFTDSTKKGEITVATALGVKRRVAEGGEAAKTPMTKKEYTAKLKQLTDKMIEQVNAKPAPIPTHESKDAEGNTIVHYKPGELKAYFDDGDKIAKQYAAGLDALRAEYKRSKK